MKSLKKVNLIIISTAGLLISAALIVNINMEKPAKALNLKAPLKSDEITKDSGKNILLSMQNAFSDIAENAGKAVVSITSERTDTVSNRYNFSGNDTLEQFFRDFFGELPRKGYKSVGLGSGLIVDSRGYILTNDHVIDRADKITVKLPDGREFAAKVAGNDFRSDLAVLKIDAHNLPLVRLGNSDRVRIGQWAVAVGNPFGFAVNSPQPTITVGVVSALHRSLPAREYRDRIYADLIQTDAAINPGNSGGPLLNIYGEVIGINVAIYTTSGGNEGIGFAIPSNQARYVIDRLIAGKDVEYGWLGIQIQDLNKDLAEYLGINDQKGAMVAGVVPGGPAEKSDIKEGDIIRKIDGTIVNDTKELVAKVLHTPIGQKVRLEIIRDKKTRVVGITIEKRPERIGKISESAQGKSWRGISVTDISEDIRRRYSISAEQGVIITAIKVDSPAREAGLKPGDVILEIDRKVINNISDFNAVTGKLTGRALIRTHRLGYIILPAEK